MGALFSTGKRAAPIEAESAASHPANFTSNTDTNQILPSATQPPLKRRRIEPHNDPITPLYVPASVPTKEVKQAAQRRSGSPEDGPTSEFERRNKPWSDQKQRNNVVVALGAAMQARRRLKKRMIAILMGFNGAKYTGMQLNPNVVTIEGLLMQALHKAGLIPDEFYMQPSPVRLMRAARTDKGVSAAMQVVSIRLEFSDEQLSDISGTVDLINSYLPDDIRIFDLLRVTGSFNARLDCRKRRYEYIFPLHLLGGENIVNTDGLRGQDSRVQTLSAILKNYEGSQCFANFTTGLELDDDKSRRYMMSVSCLPPFRPPGSSIYYVTVEVIGQSFLLHQIRRMVGLALIVYHAHYPAQSMQVALCGQVKFSTPMAPAEGLLLDTLYFDHCNKKMEDSIPHALSDEFIAQTQRKFKAEHIYRKIAQRELEGKVIEQWVTEGKLKTQFTTDEVLEMHVKYVQTDVGKREQRDQYVASLYRIRTSVEEFLDCGLQDQTRQLVENVRSKFKFRYGTGPTFMTRAPGRIILIGEHLDYNGLPVVSAALRQGTIIAGVFDDARQIDVSHLEDSVYRPGRMDANGALESQNDDDDRDISSDRGNSERSDDDERDGRWLRYVSAGVKATAQHLKFKRTVSGGGRLLISGDLPRAGGLASSSSLVCASVLAGARLSRRRLPRQKLAAEAAETERGGAQTCGGSVDHLTSLCAEKGYAMHVTFVPEAQVKHLKWPREAKLFVVNSGTIAEKGGDESVRSKFNLRAAECRIGTAIVARRLKFPNPGAIITPGQLLYNACKSNMTVNCKDLQELIENIRAVVEKDERITVEDTEDLLADCSERSRNRIFGDVDCNKIDSFSFGNRILHVFEEARRVEQFVELLSSGEKADGSNLVDKMGKILNQGQDSLKYLFESSIEKVDDIVHLCRNSGAAGSRMTGAGWGGYVVNVVHERCARNFSEAMSTQVGKDNVFEIEPWSGATVLSIHGNSDKNKSKSSKERSRKTEN